MSKYNKNGFSDVVNKPYSVNELENILHNLLGKKK